MGLVDSMGSLSTGYYHLILAPVVLNWADYGLHGNNQISGEAQDVLWKLEACKVRIADNPEIMPREGCRPTRTRNFVVLLRVGVVKSCRVQAHDTEGIGIVDVQAVEMAAEWHRKSADSKNKAPRTVVHRALETWELRLVLAFGTSSAHCE